MNAGLICPGKPRPVGWHGWGYPQRGYPHPCQRSGRGRSAKRGDGEAKPNPEGMASAGARWAAEATISRAKQARRRFSNLPYLRE